MRAYGTLMGLLTVGLLVSTASAQLMINPAGRVTNDKIELSVSAAYSSIDYGVSGYEGSSAVDRWCIGASFAKPVDEATELCGSVTWLARSSPDVSGVSSGSGYALSFGARRHMFERGLGAISIYGLGHYTDESFGSGTIDHKLSIFEISGGVVGTYAFLPSLTGYAAAELIAYSDGKVQVEDRYDIERDSRVTIRGGAVFDMTKYWIRTELALGSETALVVGVGQAF